MQYVVEGFCMNSSNSSTVRRAFVDVPFGQMHYRHAGSGPTLVLFHASPGSSKQLEPLIALLAKDFHVLAPDTPGNGDSSALPVPAPSISDYTQAMIEFLDALDLDMAHVYGTHTGACLASELALLVPSRVDKLIQDGVVIFSPQEREELIANYARPFEPNLNGTHLMDAFMFCRDQFIFFPWYANDKEHMRDAGLPSPEPLHAWVVEVLKAATTYHLAYRAAFAYPADQRLPLVKQPVLCVAASDDPLGPATQGIVNQLADGRFVPIPRYDDERYLDALSGAIGDFLKS
jgi:pimeloyl-ACP methyl ester carboxylesterase